MKISIFNKISVFRMKIISMYKNNEPFILHFPGQSMKSYFSYFEYLLDKKIKYNEDIHVLYICTDDIDSPLEKQLIKNNIPHTNIISYVLDDFKRSKKWSWMFKPYAIKRFLNDKQALESKNISENTTFIVLDASDVLINNLENIAYTCYKNFGANRIVFCGSKSDYPNMFSTSYDYKQFMTYKTEYPCNVNCGCMMANMETLSLYVNNLIEINLTCTIKDFKLNKYLIDDDQYITKMMIHSVMLGHKKLRVDESCLLFKIFSWNHDIRIDNKNNIIYTL